MRRWPPPLHSACVFRHAAACAPTESTIGVRLPTRDGERAAPGPTGRASSDTWRHTALSSRALACVFRQVAANASCTPTALPGCGNRQRGNALARQAPAPGRSGTRRRLAGAAHAERRSGTRSSSADSPPRAATTAIRAASSSADGSPLTTCSSTGARATGSGSDISAFPHCHLVRRPIPVPRTRGPAHRGMFPCFFGGSVSRLLRRSLNERTISDLVSCGAITASM